MTPQERDQFIELLNKFSDDVMACMEKSGFNDKPLNEGESIALMHSELSELLEGLRHGDPPDAHCPEFSSSEIESADVIYRILHFGKRKGGMRIGEALFAKHLYNLGRPFRHNKLF